VDLPTEQRQRDIKSHRNKLGLQIVNATYLTGARASAQVALNIFVMIFRDRLGGILVRLQETGQTWCRRQRRSLDVVPAGVADWLWILLSSGAVLISMRTCQFC
jgi:hypothetical protein